MNTQHTRSRRRILLGALGLLILAVPNIPAATPVPFNVDWVLAEMNGKAVEALTGGKTWHATLKLDGEKKRASGVSFVNRYSGTYEMKDSALTFGRMITTRMASTNTEANKAEQDFHAMLKDVNGWRLTDGKLELLAIDKVVARFTEKAEAKK